MVFGLDEIVINKYLPCISAAIRANHLDGYSIVDLESERTVIEERLRAVDPGPEHRCYVSSPSSSDGSAPPPEVATFINGLVADGRQLRGYIATEVSAHQIYLQFCLERQIDCLVEKPAVAPLDRGTFAIDQLTPIMEHLAESARRTGTSCSVMTLSRYHSIYNDILIGGLRRRLLEHEAPVTSLHLRAAGGVWNRLCEFSDRQDHAYTFGYGMLMHGAYHYVDLACQILELNLHLFSDRPLELVVTGFGAFPTDQPGRVPKSASSAIGDDADERSLEGMGETDVVAAFALNDAVTKQRITLGTLSFEQTTPSVRAWREFPEGIYNKNGRTSSVDVEAQISTLYTAHVHCYDIPRTTNADKIDAYARVTTRANASLLPDEEYVTTSSHDGLFHSDSNRELMRQFLAGTERRSSIASHVGPTRITQALASAIATPGTPVTSRFP